MAKRMKKWFMLQVWRLQQVAQILTLVLLAVNLALQIFGLIKWREDSPLSVSYVGVPMILLVLAMAIWTFAIVWDLRLKMWREQMTVVTERNPYAKEKMSAKEVVVYDIIWVRLLEKIGKEDPEIMESARALKLWLSKEVEKDKALARDVKELLSHIGKE